MAINVAGTNAIGDYLAGQIQNTRILMGEAAPTIGPSSVPSTTPANQLTPAQLQQQLADAKLAHTAELLGAAPPAETSFPAAALAAPLAAPSAADAATISTAAELQSAAAAQNLADTALLLGAAGVGTNVNSLA